MLIFCATGLQIRPSVRQPHSTDYSEGKGTKNPLFSAKNGK